ncbi:MAG: 50S ribosomal protein L22 [bacterium]|nr:50S ribosomal protein L22 [bacterium]
MIITAQQKNIRQSSRKVRLVANQVKKLDLTAAVDQLAVMQRRSSLAILKVMQQAIANATNNEKLAVDQLVLSDIIVSDGPVLKRMRAVSRGRGHAIEKRTCHVTVTLKTKEETSVEKTEKAPKASPSKTTSVKPAQDDKKVAEKKEKKSLKKTQADKELA